jgi:hypoxanthine phosphoribosyltransferase
MHSDGSGSGSVVGMSDSDVVVEVISEAALASRISELGEAISADYGGRTPIVVAVMNGALWFLADLVRAFDMPHEVDFLMLNRFGEGGRIRIATDTSQPLTGRDVIIVEDIVDTGLSLTVLRKMIEDREPASLSVVTLLDKVTRRLVDVPLEYRGFEVGDEYLVGYGLDHRHKLRNLRSVWAVLDLEAFQNDPDIVRRLASRST